MISVQGSGDSYADAERRERRYMRRYGDYLVFEEARRRWRAERLAMRQTRAHNMIDRHEHTSEPWRIDRDLSCLRTYAAEGEETCYATIAGGDARHGKTRILGRGIFAANSPNHVNDYDEFKANVRLILAAPRLLVALQVVHDDLEANGSVTECTKSLLADALKCATESQETPFDN